MSKISIMINKDVWNYYKQLVTKHSQKVLDHREICNFVDELINHDLGERIDEIEEYKTLINKIATYDVG